MRIIGIISYLLIVSIFTSFACTSPTVSPTASSSLTPSPIEFTEITAPFTLNGEEPGTDIPWGSVIYHWNNGITEVYGADGNLMLIAKDSEAKMLPHPSGPEGPFESPATYLYQVPSGSHISTDESANTTTVKFEGKVILTIIGKSEDYPLN